MSGEPHAFPLRRIWVRRLISSFSRSRAGGLRVPIVGPEGTPKGVALVDRLLPRFARLGYFPHASPIKPPDPARRHGYPLAIAFLDLDDFKQVNDTAGHESRDRLLKEAAQAWHSSLRKSDAILRWGGEEFLLVLPYTDCTQAEHLVHHRQPALHRPDGKPLTFSVGIAEWRADDVTGWRALGALADERMYQAKIAGKARIVARPTRDPSSRIGRPDGSSRPPVGAAQRDFTAPP